MATTIVLKNSVTTTNTPSSLAQGEIAINVTDKKVWVGNAATTPIQIVNGGPDGVFTSVTDSGLTINRLTYAGTGGLLKDSANIVTDGSKITTSTGFVGGPWTTATRPASPATGQEGFNTTLGVVEVYNGTAWVAAATIVPTVTTYTSSSGTYTTPTGAKYLFVKMAGAGGGGGGSGTGSQTGGGAGGTSTFGTSLLTCTGGSSQGGSANIGSGGGSATIGTGASGLGLTGGRGQGSGAVAPPSLSGGMGGANPFGGGGTCLFYNTDGGAGIANTGSGGAGGSMNAGGTYAGAGGGAGGYIEAIITSPSSTYSYAVGAGGTAGAAGTLGNNGGAGAAGVIFVTAYF